MKRILALILAALMLTALVACQKDEVEIEDEFIDVETDVNDDSVVFPALDEGETEDEAPEETPDPTPEVKPGEDKKPAAKPEAKPEVKPEEKPADPAPEAKPEPEAPVEPEAPEAPSAGETMGDIMLSVFRANRDKSLDDIANACISDKSIQFFGMTAPVEEGFFAEFDGDVKGFSKCVKFGPAMGSIAFSGMIFEVSGDAEAFAKDLKSRANPRWNICVEADQTVCEVYGNRVFFLMCPKTLGE